MNLSDAFREAERLSRLIDAGIEALREQSKQLAQAEAEYRRAKAQAWVRCPRDEAKGRDWTAGRREAWVDAETADLRYVRDVAEGMRQADGALKRLKEKQPDTAAAVAAWFHEQGLPPVRVMNAEQCSMVIDHLLDMTEGSGVDPQGDVGNPDPSPKEDS
jgi:hypothetical protein